MPALPLKSRLHCPLSHAPQVMEEEDSSGVAWPHDLLLLRDAAHAQLRQLQASDAHAAWIDNVQAAMNATLPWPAVRYRDYPN